MADGLGLDRLDHLVGHAEHRIATKADQHLATVHLVGEAVHGQRHLDHGRVVLVGDVLHARPADQTVGEHPVLVAVQRLLDAVGGEQDRSREVGELLLLVLPGGAEVAVEVRVLLQLRVAVAGQHLAVGVNVDALALGLLEEHLQVTQVMAGDEHALVLAMPQRHRGRHRVTVGAGVAGIEQLHGLEVDLAGLEHERHALLHGHPLGQHGGQGLVAEGGHGRVGLAEDGGVVGIGGNALEAVEHGLLERADVLVRVQVFDQVQRLALGDQIGHAAGRDEAGRCLAAVALATGGRNLGLHGLAQFDGAFDQGDEPLRVEIDVGQGGEDRLVGEAVGGVIDDAQPAAFLGVQGETLHGVDEQILEIGDLLVLAADADDAAAGSLGGLFTLVAKHGCSPLLGF